MIEFNSVLKPPREIDEMEGNLLVCYQQYAITRTYLIQRMTADGAPIENADKVNFAGLKENYFQSLFDAMWTAFLRGYQRMKNYLLPYMLQEPPFAPHIWSLLQRVVAEKVKIEENTTKKEVKRIVMDGIKEGLNPNDIADKIHQKVGLEMRRARNIATTEVNVAYELGHWVGIVEAGVEKVRIIAAHDAFTCEDCARMDGKVIEVSKLEQGFLPPFHYQCRCHIQPLVGTLARVPLSKEVPELPLMGKFVPSWFFTAIRKLLERRAH
jgi:SPP1 gp7 family putative phage head morphogenesis protein